MEQVSYNVGMGIYPNPASEYATIAITLKEASDVQMGVYNLLGDEVYSMDKSQLHAGTSYTTVDVSSLSSGIYVVKLYSGSEVHAQKLVVR